jgi:predicted MFS family arabinose efflux permease
MWWTANNYQLIFWIAVLPAFIAIAILVFFVREPKLPTNTRPRKLPLNREDLGRLGSRYWWVVAIGLAFTLARFSEAFLILRGEASGLPPMWAPAVLVVMGVAFSLSAYPAGVLSDRMRKTDLLLIGVALLIAADLVLAFVPGLLGLGLGVALWGLHMGFTQGLFNVLIADNAPAELRGTAFGMFHLLTGIALLLASVIAGVLWDTIGFQGTFAAGAIFAVLTGAGLITLQRSAQGAF